MPRLWILKDESSRTRSPLSPRSTGPCSDPTRTPLDTALIRDPALRRRFYGSPAYQPVLPGPGEPLEEALDAASIPLDAIHAVAVSHLHADHAGGLKHFAGRVPVHVRRAELAYGLSGQPEVERNSIFRVDFDDPRLDWQQADGDREIAPGVTAVLTAGHTPGHQSFVVDLADGGGFVFALDAADLTENIEHERAIGASIGVDPARTVEPSAGSRASPRSAAGEYPDQAEPGADGVHKWQEENRSLDGTELVLWATVGSHHFPRPEEWPVMPVARARLRLEPDGFFDRNPALDVPAPVSCHAPVPTAAAEDHCCG